MSSSIYTPSRALHILSVICVIALIILGLGWELWWAPLRPGGSWLALKVLPLLCPLSGLIKRNHYTMQWSAMLLLLYLTEGIVRAYSDQGIIAHLAWLEIILVSIAFISLIIYLRPLKKAAKQKLSAAPSSSR